MLLKNVFNFMVTNISRVFVGSGLRHKDKRIYFFIVWGAKN